MLSVSLGLSATDASALRPRQATQNGLEEDLTDALQPAGMEEGAVGWILSRPFLRFADAQQARAALECLVANEAAQKKRLLIERLEDTFTVTLEDFIYFLGSSA